MSTSGIMKTLAFHHPAPGKSGRMPELSVESISPIHPALTRRQEAANEHPRDNENLGFSSSRPRKVGQDARACREVSPHPPAKSS